MLLSVLLTLPIVALAKFPPKFKSTAPPVFIDEAVITGVNNGSLSKYLGIPFAEAPRFRLPVPISYYKGHIEATKYGPICPQQQVTPSNQSRRSLGDHNDESEDCLSINVIRPKTTRTDHELPVLVWIYGGGFQVGSTLLYDDVSMRIVTRSIEMNKPVVHVAMNYRLSALGFLASKEVQDEGLGNFGLYDQRVALRWVQKYIRAFGGDPDKVTIWGQSAGAVSVSLQMLAFVGDTQDLFRGAFMQSGAPPPVGYLSDGQIYYDALVVDAGCESAEDTLDCLRSVPFDTIMAAINKSPDFHSYSSIRAAWSPRADGIFLQDKPVNLIAQGKVANIPFVSGNVDDEATLFSVSQSNVTTDADFRNYIKTVWFPDASEAQLEPFWTTYPWTPSEGSPYDTGSANILYPQYKRIASFQGDLMFQGPRRYFIRKVAGGQKVWSYLSKRYKWTSVYGSFHSSDIETGLLDDYVISFTDNLDPNLSGHSTPWPQYCTSDPKLLTITEESDVEPYISDDTFRSVPIQYLHDLADKYPV